MANAEILVKIVDQTRGGMSTVKQNLDDVSSSAKNASGSIFNVANALKAVATSFVVSEIVQFGSEIQNLQNRLKLLPDSFGSVGDNLDRVRQIANDTQQPLGATADLFQKVARQADRYGLSADQAGIVTRTFADVLRLAGADAAAADGAIRQFGQALGSGTLRGDEFNSILEATAGEILPILAKQLGVTEGEVRSMAEQGKITGDVLINALGNAADTVAQRTGNMTVTIGGALTVLQNNFLALGSQATPVFDSIAKGILLIAENLDVAVVAAGAFLTAMAVTKISAIVSAMGGLRAAILAVNTAIMANPIGLIMTAMAAAITGVYVYWDELKFYAVNAFTYIEMGYHKFVIALTQATEDMINGMYSGWQSFTDNLSAIFAGLGAAIMDPFNATEAFSTAMRESLAASASEATEKLVDFSGSLSDNRARLSELETKLSEARTQLNNTTTATNANTTATNANAGGWNNVKDSAAGANKELEKAQANYKNFIADLERSVELAQYDSAERQRQQTIYKALELRAKALGTTVAKLGDIERAEVTATVQALLEKQAAYEAERKLIEERTEFIKDTEKEIRDVARETMNAVQKLEQEKNEYITEARRLGVLEHQATQNRILAYEDQISRARVELEKDLAKERQKLIDDTVSEYSSLYGFMGDKLEEFTGISRKEFGLINDVTKLVFGTDIKGIFDETFARGILNVQSFRSGSTNAMEGISDITRREMAASEGSVGDFANNSLTTMANWVKAVFNNFSTLGGGIIEILGTAFQWLTGGFSSVFGSLSSFIGGFFGNIGNLIGGINISGFTDLFKAEGGYIPAGSFGIAGEAGPEVIQGPAYVTSTTDTADLLSNMGSGGSINVTMNISTVDARGFDELLTSRRDVITDLVRTAVIESPSRQFKGVY